LPLSSSVMNTEGLHVLVDTTLGLAILLPHELQEKAGLPVTYSIIQVRVDSARLTEQASDRWLLSVDFSLANRTEGARPGDGKSAPVSGDETEVDDEGGMSEYRQFGYEWP